MFTRIYDLTCHWYRVARKFPKPDRYTIGNEIFSYLIVLLVGITKAEYLDFQRKRALLNSLSPTLDTIKILVRLANSLDILPDKHSIPIQGELQEIGKMLGGWIRSIS